jgi:hypothetical protein
MVSFYHASPQVLNKTFDHKTKQIGTDYHHTFCFLMRLFSKDYNTYTYMTADQGYE